MNEHTWVRKLLEAPLTPNDLETLKRQAYLGRRIIIGSSHLLMDGLAPLTPEDIRLIQDSILPDLPGLSTIRAIRNCIDHLRNAYASGDYDPEVIARHLGALYGFAIQNELGWTPVFLNGEVAWVSDDRSMAAYPMRAIRRLLEDPASDNTVALSVNLLKAGDLPSYARPGSYTVVIR